MSMCVQRVGWRYSILLIQATTIFETLQYAILLLLMLRQKFVEDFLIPRRFRSMGLRPDCVRCHSLLFWVICLTS